MSKLIAKLFFIMKMSSLRALIFLIFLFTSFAAPSQTETSPCEKVEKMLYLIQKLHFQPPVVDKIFASKVIENYLFYIDGQCRSLYDKDVLALKNIQNQETSPSAIFCKSYDYLTSIYEKRLKETDNLLLIAKTKKYSWNKNDSIAFYDAFRNNYPKDQDQKIKKVDDCIKLYTLRQLEVVNKLEKDFEFEKNDNLKLKAIAKLRKGLDKKINATNGIASYLEENLLQAIISTCDPHSDYFTPVVNEHFKEELSTTKEIYGFTFQENKDEHLEIIAVMPGSPAWKSNNMNVGDQITKVKLQNKPEVDVTDYETEEFNTFLDNATEKELDLTLLKKSGETVVTHLKKAIVKSEENTVNGYVLEEKYPIGYISLPSFYTDFSTYTSNGCANDVAKEIIKLKEDNIQGLILDLRNNGGGSIEEAMNLAGIFIDAGPLFIEKIQNQKPHVMKDMNRGAIYTGPLVVLINKASASASELLALMLKTQQRAIIAGSTSFGKATGQIIVPLDTSYTMMNPGARYNEKNGYVKMTIEKLFDLSGTTYQKQGVAPHIPIPDLWSSLYKGEKDFSNALSNDVIDKKVKIEAVTDTKILTCADLSAERVKADKQFKRTRSLSDTLNKLYAKQTYSLYPSTYNELIKASNAIEKIIDAFSTSDSLFTIKPTRNTAEVMKMDEFLQTTIQSEISNLNKDAILKEAYHILIDYNSN
jgi:carboxyl-terminal processing protease